MADQLIVQAGSALFGFVNAPRRLFKFFSHEAHARALGDKGEVRIGTLYEFRATDGWDSVRGDAAEGQFTLSLESTQPETITKDSAPWYLRPVIEQLGMPILSHGGTLNAIPHHPDAYIFCTTALQSANAIGAYGEYLVEIHDVVAFFTTVTRHLTDVLGLASTEPHGFLAPCLYLERGIKITSAGTEVAEPPLAFIKPPAKRDEQEVRAIWHPARPNLQPLITVCPELTRYCSFKHGDTRSPNRARGAQ